MDSFLGVYATASIYTIENGTSVKQIEKKMYFTDKAFDMVKKVIGEGPTCIQLVDPENGLINTYVPLFNQIGLGRSNAPFDPTQSTLVDAIATQGVASSPFHENGVIYYIAPFSNVDSEINEIGLNTDSIDYGVFGDLQARAVLDSPFLKQEFPIEIRIKIELKREVV